MCISAILAYSLIKSEDKSWYSVHNYPADINQYKFVRKFYESFLDKLISKTLMA